MGRGLTIELTDLIGTPSVVTVRNSVIGRTHELGVAVIGSEATIESTVVRDVVPQASDGAAGRGIGVEDHASTALPSKVTLRSSLVERTHDIGIMTQSSDTTLESVIVRDTQARQPDGWFGRGLHVQLSSMTLAPASLTVRSSLIDRNFEMGILVHGGHAAIETTLVRQTAARLDGLLGDGVAIHGGDSLTGQATIQGSRIEANARAGIVTFSASVALGSTTLECNTIQLDGENLLGPFALDDLGGNVCGCAGAQTQCAVVTTALEPPAPLD
jgi:hypothetical protein